MQTLGKELKIDVTETEFNEDLATELANLIYYGLNVRDCGDVLGLRPDAITTMLCDVRYVKVIKFAKAKAKFELLKSQVEIALDTGHRDSQKSGQCLLASRFGITQDKAKIKHEKEMHTDNMEFKRGALKQQAEIHATRLITQASAAQLTDWKAYDVEPVKE